MKANLDWAGEFMTMAERMARCKSEEQMYQQLRNFKEMFNSEYGKLSCAKRNKDGFRQEALDD